MTLKKKTEKERGKEGRKKEKYAGRDTERKKRS